ncbi:hypothetical protein [Natrinema longum]|uniref:Uncharacterized protein n=1 Tax=Natrinema longum TaxID=370324 RepID=A0A8A2U912_9EURY|nr:hypothetical protein [Natrinema longum]MBZ6493442.1 hypothetical protein [Natrinema longum]QSW85211.1 hypothetical protein J0X27_17480 [Natrinema longum]
MIIDSSPSEAGDLVDELDRGLDFESAAKIDHETGPDIDPDTIGGEPIESEGHREPVDRRIVTEDGSEIDRRPAETPGEYDRTAVENRETVPEDGAAHGSSTTAGTDDRSRAPTPLSVTFAVQRATLEPAKRTAELHGRLAGASIASGIALQRQQLNLAGTVASVPVGIAAATMGAGDGRSGVGPKP